MNWVKKNPAQFALAIVSLVMIVSAVFLFLQSSAFAELFAGSSGGMPSKKVTESANVAPVENAIKEAVNPDIWNRVDPKTGARLLTAKRYVQKGTSIEKPEGGMFNPPVPNDWLEKYGLDPLNQTVLEEDADKDGFPNGVEFDGMDGKPHLAAPAPGQPVMGADNKPLPDDSTDPTNAENHPPYYTRLRVQQVINIPFRLRFMSYDINPRDPKDITVGINTIDLNNRTKFVPVGELIPDTKYRTKVFTKKEAPGLDGTKKDVSELTVENTETHEEILLPLTVVKDSPESYIVMAYLWTVPGAPASEFPKNLRKDQTFKIPPEDNKEYKLKAIGPDAEKGLQQNEVLIELPGGQTFKVGPK